MPSLFQIQYDLHPDRPTVLRYRDEGIRQDVYRFAAGPVRVGGRQFSEIGVEGLCPLAVACRFYREMRLTLEGSGCAQV